MLYDIAFDIVTEHRNYLRFMKLFKEVGLTVEDMYALLTESQIMMINKAAISFELTVRETMRNTDYSYEEITGAIGDMYET